MLWLVFPSLLLLLHYSKATYYTADEYARELPYDGGGDDQIANIVDELKRARNSDEWDIKPEYDDVPSFVNIDLQRGTNKSPKPVTAQKKGQNEFVEFIEPKSSNQLKHVDNFDKRVGSEISAQQTIYGPLAHTGNFLFIALATVCMVGMAAGIASGTYYFYRTKTQKDAAEGYDFTYAPTGPGKNKKKKGGDEGLAYKAQLHHYQQAKQKIISGEDGTVGIPDPETSETSDDDMNNFSVYECPGLAPTGDIEVQNPNFVTQKP